MKPIQDTEWDVLDVLWQRERGTAREVAEGLAQRRGWAYSTVKTMLDRMVDKGLVEARKVGNVWEYAPAMGRDEAQKSAWGRFVETVLGGALSPALELLAGDKRLSKRQRAQLQRLLDEEKKR